MYDEDGAIGFIIMEKCPGMAVGGFSGHFFFYIQSKGVYKGQGIAVILVHIMLHSESARDGILAGASCYLRPRRAVRHADWRQGAHGRYGDCYGCCPSTCSMSWRLKHRLMIPDRCFKDMARRAKFLAHRAVGLTSVSYPTYLGESIF